MGISITLAEFKHEFQWTPEGLLFQLSDDLRKIQAMRKQVCEVSKKYFGSPRARFEAMLLDAALYVHQPNIDVAWWSTTTTMTSHIPVQAPSPNDEIIGGGPPEEDEDSPIP